MNPRTPDRKFAFMVMRGDNVTLCLLSAGKIEESIRGARDKTRLRAILALNTRFFSVKEKRFGVFRR